MSEELSEKERISALTEKESEKLLGQENFRQRVKAIIEEHANSVEFLEKVRKYAGMEIDSRLFVSVKYWVTIILTAIITSIIGVLITVLIRK